MTRRSDIEILSDLEALDHITQTPSIEFSKCSKKLRAAAARSHDREYTFVTKRPITLPKLKFLESKD